MGNNEEAKQASDAKRDFALKVADLAQKDVSSGRGDRYLTVSSNIVLEIVKAAKEGRL